MKKDSVPFIGFPKKMEKNFWQYPQVLDRHWYDLSGSEQKVLDYILRRTLGWQKLSDKISLSQFQRGIGKKDNGTGLSRKTIIEALSKLERKGYITSKRGVRDGKYRDTNEYTLVIETPQPVSESNQPNEQEKPLTGTENELVSSYESTQTIDNKTIERTINKLHRRYTQYIKSGARLTEKGRENILARLNGQCRWKPKQLAQAIRNFSENGWEMENNSHRGLAWFFESDDRIDKYLNYESDSERYRQKSI